MHNKIPTQATLTVRRNDTQSPPDGASFPGWSARDQQVADDQRAFEEWMRRPADERERIKRASECWSNARVPPRFRSLPPPSDHLWWQALRKLQPCIGRGSSIVLLGNSGTGKTHLAAALLGTACNLGFTARYVECYRLFPKLREAYRPDADSSELEVFESFVRPQVLVLDELQGFNAGSRADADSSWEAATIRQLIDQRYSARRDTILVSNLSPSQIALALGAYAVSRIQETGGVVECTWDSFRTRRSDAA